MKKIKSLTPDQIVKFADYVRKWTDIGLSTQPADRPRAEKAINRIYEIAGLNPPKEYVWCNSPFEMYKLVKNNNVSNSVWDSVYNSINHDVWDSVLNRVLGKIFDNVRINVENILTVRVLNNVRFNVSNIILNNSNINNVFIKIINSIRGQHDADRLAFYEYFHDICNLTKETLNLEGLWEFAKSAGWAYPEKDICYISERHTTLNLDDRGRAHSLIGPAIQYPDGWSIYASHGVNVPSYVIESPQNITIDKIHNERNTEIQRVMIEQYGWDKYADNCGAKLIDYDERWGSLYRRNDNILFMRVTNRSPEPDGSFRQYILPLAPNCAPLPDPFDTNGVLGRRQKLTALNGVASTFGMTGNKYKKLFIES